MSTNRGKTLLDAEFQYAYELCKHDLSILQVERGSARGVRKVTTGIIGLWKPSVHRDVDF